MPLLGGSNTKGAVKTDSGYVIPTGSSKSSSSTAPSTSAPSTSAPSGASGTSTSSKPNTAELNKILANSSLTDAEKQAITAVYNAVYAGDQAEAQRLAANIELAKQYADPLLKQQLALITDDLDRTIKGFDQNLEYQETTLQNRLSDLRKDVSLNRENLTLDHQQQLKELESYFGQKLSDTQDQLAASGFTASSRRMKKEGILAEQKGSMVESENRAFATSNRNLDENLARSERDTSLELQRLRDLTTQNKTSAARTAEGQIGTKDVSGLSSVKDIPTLGSLSGTDITGTEHLNYQNELLQFA